MIKFFVNYFLILFLIDKPLKNFNIFDTYIIKRRIVANNQTVFATIFFFTIRISY